MVKEHRKTEKMISIIIPSANEPKIQQVMDNIEKVIRPNQIIVCNDRYGKGKGWAVRQAMEQATGDKILYIDGDGDIRVREIKKVLAYLGEYDVVVTKKNLPKRFDRTILTLLSRSWLWLLFRFWIDTQTGLKGFTYKPEWKTDGWAFDVEILYKARKMGKSMIEIPIKACVSDSKSLKDIWRTFIETIKIRLGL